MAVGAAARASAFPAREEEPGLTEVVGQVRSTAADLVRASELLADTLEPSDRPTEELLGEPHPRRPREAAASAA